MSNKEKIQELPEESTKQAVMQKKKDTAYIYVGPTLRADMFLETYVVVKDPNIYVKLRPDTEKLFVPVTDLAKAKKALKDRKSELFKAYIECYKKEAEILKKKRG